MSRILLLGMGPPPHENPPYVGFPQLRTDGFLTALTQAGHEVVWIPLRAPGQPWPQARADRIISMDEPDWIHKLGERVRRFAPEAVVSAGPYHPLRAAIEVAGTTPLWADVPGDPFAESQALNEDSSSHEVMIGEAGLDGQDSLDALRNHTAQTGAFLPILLRADMLSACSGPQRHALVGQLGLAGRLARVPPGEEWVHVMPPAYDFGGLAPGRPRRRAPGSRLRIGLFGGWNAWLDDSTLLGGLIQALHEGADLEIVCAGGGIPGHHLETFRRFRQAAETSPWAARFQWPGWVPHRDLPHRLSPTHATINLDIPGYEPELGSRTRLLFALHQGMAVLTTTGCELAMEMHASGFATALPRGDPTALALALCSLWRQGQDGAVETAAQAWARDRFAPSQVYAPLLRWAEAPCRRPPGDEAAVLLARENELLKAEIAAIRRSPTWRGLDGANRGLRRLLGLPKI